ncbi:MAG: hypothetical protein Q8Q92_02360 [bacterium]|nr:hypothetical protein [bacterium]
MTTQEQIQDIRRGLLLKVEETNSLLIQLNTLIFSADEEEQKLIVGALKVLEIRTKLTMIRINQIVEVIGVLRAKSS